MANLEQPIVIKKVTEVVGGGHGGAWKVAFADFMTAMMAFFLVMWLLAQSEETKSQVASYFTGPSMLEHEFTSYGAELTLEKLFLDLTNEPLKTVQQFMQPADFTPNLMAMGHKKIVLHHVAQELGPLAKNVTIESDKVIFELNEEHLFKRGSSDPAPTFVDVMSKLNALTMGLDNSVVDIESNVYIESIKGGNPLIAKRVSGQRLDLIKNKVIQGLEHDTVDVVGKPQVKKLTDPNGKPNGTIRVEIRQKEFLPDGTSPRKLEGGDAIKARDESKDVYNDFVDRLSRDPTKRSKE